MNVRIHAVAAILLLAPVAAYSYDFVPNEAEWSSWPEYCKARYSTTMIGVDGGFGSRVDQSQVLYWQGVLREAFTHVHHHCAGLVYAARAAQTNEETEARRRWDRARSESRYTYQRTDTDNPFREELAVYLARAEYNLKNVSAAFQVLQEAVDNGARTAKPYVFYAICLDEEGELDKAITLLQLAKSRGINKSAELEYVLGLFLLQANRWNESYTAAKQAYSLGYPLPGLKNKLQEHGYSFD